ncbi:MAG TPA: Ig-like domain-containing protein [Candidatus Saccharimonadales bacterium]|nr:Ig-like domain-containing protein [Candidatus Saccharimonadales bacterium]
MRLKQRFAAILACSLLLCASQAMAVKTSLWTQDGADDFLTGDVTGVTVTSDGQVLLGASWDSVVTGLPDVSQIWCLARDSKGRTYFGTGDQGRIYRWSPGSKPQLVWETGSSEIMSLAVDAEDNVYAGGSPGGIVYRVTARGDTSRYYETGEQSIWALTVGKNGTLYAGTGSRGRIYKITGPKKGEMFADTRDLNVLALAWAKDGALLAGTSSKGLLLRIDPANGLTRVIYDSGAEELRAIAVLDDGSIAVGTNRGASGSSTGSAGSPAAGALGVEITPSSGAKCGVYLVQPDGSARLLSAPPCDFVYALAPGDGSSVWFTTGNPAALFRVGLDRKFALLGATESKQLLGLLRTPKETLVAAGNAAVLYSLGAGPGPVGTYVSEAHDLRSVASWGEARVALSGGGEALWSSRSGFSKTPDDGWSGWSREVPIQGYVKIESPPARFFQYRLRLKRGSGEAPTVSTVEIAYLQRNLPPSIANVTLYGPENPYFEGGPEYRPPQISQSFPNGMKLEFSMPRSGPRPVSDPSAAWARGIRSASWEAADPNGDNLSYKLFIKADDEKSWKPLTTDLGDRAYSWDAESFANGTYRLKVEATDAPDNPDGTATTTERLSPPFLIDNIPPRVENLRTASRAGSTRDRTTVTVSGSAADTDSRIAKIEYSVDGGDWKQIFPDDTIFDSLRESFHFDVPDLAAGEHAITVRASDSQRNVSVGKILAVTR